MLVCLDIVGLAVKDNGAFMAADVEMSRRLCGICEVEVLS